MREKAIVLSAFGGFLCVIAIIESIAPLPCSHVPHVLLLSAFILIGVISLPFLIVGYINLWNQFWNNRR